MYSTGSVCVGTVTAGDVLLGQTFSGTAGLGLTGTMPDNGAVTITPSTMTQTIAAGYHHGSGTVAGDADLVASNIKNGIDLFGVLGTYNPLIATGNATVGQVLSGQTFSNTSGANLTGTMPNLGAVTLTSSTTPQTIAAGYHDGSGTVAGDANLVTGNIKSGVTLFGVSGKTEVVDTTEATSPTTAANLLSGKKAFVNGVAVTGTVPAGANVTGTAGSLVMTIPNGLYLGSTTATANDANLTAGNIKSGVTIFGVTGTVAAGSTYNAVVPKTGQTTSYVAGDDGALQKGVASPPPRFTDNSNGTVTDNLTGLIWLKDANCFNTANWTTALSNANSLASGTCSLTDGSTAGQWRLPNRKELDSLIDLSNVSPALSTGHLFTGVQSNYYWSASSDAGVAADAWVVDLIAGYVNAYGKTGTTYVWPMRGG
jgi:hypothetical protein